MDFWVKQPHSLKISGYAKASKYDVSIECFLKVQAALVICGLFICNFSYMQSRNGLFSGTYPLIYSNPVIFLHVNLLYACLFLESLSLAYNEVYLYIFSTITLKVQNFDRTLKNIRSNPRSNTILKRRFLIQPASSYMCLKI